MRMILSFIWALGLLIAIPLYIIFFLTIPLGILAVMHFTGFSILYAAICYAILCMLPIISFFMAFAPFVGAYYLIINDFDWHKAATPEERTRAIISTVENATSVGNGYSIYFSKKQEC